MNDNFSPRVKRIFTYSKEEAVRLGQSSVGTEHFVLAMIQEGEGKAIEILQSLHTDMDRLRQHIHTLTSARGLNPPNFNAIHFTVQAASYLLRSKAFSNGNYKYRAFIIKHFAQ